MKSSPGTFCTAYIQMMIAVAGNNRFQVTTTLSIFSLLQKCSTNFRYNTLNRARMFSTFFH